MIYIVDKKFCYAYMHHYFIESDQEHHEDVLSVRHTLVAGGYAGCVGIMCFAITLVVMATPNIENGWLNFRTWMTF